MEVIETAIPEVRIIVPRKHGDHRGFFSEVWSRRALESAGIDIDFVQDNHSLSAEPGTLRGLHFQSPPHAQAKLVRVLRGAILDVAVDLRRGSPTHGRHVAVELSADNWRQLLVPRGFAHGFVTLEPMTEVFYKVDAFYAPAHDKGVRWDDPELAIDWRLGGRTPILSAKDREQPSWSELPAYFT
ncbi:MAG TPA: dTDP-4-dehydrorhamnose 3,5-epimerase [Geminicoccaceae bacterium]|mgnify:CR=1 FL=1|nr:dTDP-4-dehydrorhamnose 3,5-epimerase [Geminicoccus sp.]HMU53278.1 dTDP-4-dehydrorhamnose 3,5-epimerase [Geminicoccaceae bacterium]